MNGSAKGRDVSDVCFALPIYVQHCLGYRGMKGHTSLGAGRTSRSISSPMPDAAGAPGLVDATCAAGRVATSVEGGGPAINLYKMVAAAAGCTYGGSVSQCNNARCRILLRSIGAGWGSA